MNKVIAEGSKPLKYRINADALVLMLIAYLQHKDILPRLQYIHSEQPTLVKYYKSFKKSGVKHEYVADVSFERDISKANAHLTKNEETIAELLIGFFDFYTNVLNPETHVISTSHKEGSLISKEEYLKELEVRFAQDPNRDKIVDEARNTTFMIVDPFDWTANPAKSINRKS